MGDNKILEEEIEIISVFKYELKEFGRDGYCSFYEDVDNGYYIYKDNNIWIVDFNEKGKTISSKRYTNIYNLCIDLLNEMKIDTFYFDLRDIEIPRGTRVVITTPNDCPQDELNLGVIVGSDLQKNERGHSIRTYQVFGDDERLYTGMYGLKLYGDICFRTIEDYLKDIEKQKKENQEIIQELVDTNGDLIFLEQELLGEKDKYLNESMFKK